MPVLARGEWGGTEGTAVLAGGGGGRVPLSWPGGGGGYLVWAPPSLPLLPGEQTDNITFLSYYVRGR